MNDIMKTYGGALADVLSMYARKMTAEAGNEATMKLLEGIADGSERVVIVSQLVPFSVSACRLDDAGMPGDELFKITDAGLH